MSAKFDWRQLEDAFYKQLVNDIERFAANHNHEIFYAYALEFDCAFDIVYYAGLNTEQGLQESFELSISHGMSYESPDELRWSQGDWKYMDIRDELVGVQLEEWKNAEAEFIAERSRIEADLDSLSGRRKANQSRQELLLKEHEQLTELFATHATQAVIRMWLDEKFAALRRDDSFKILVSKHDEYHKDAEQRFRLCWKGLAPKNSAIPYQDRSH